MDSYKNKINWFPGHMAKAKREIIEILGQVDIVLEIIDARIPLSSRNPMTEEILKNKPTLVLLNKASLADKNQTKKWLAYFEEKGAYALDIDLVDDYNVKKIIPMIRQILENKMNKNQNKGIINDTIRALVVGIPNVGKSTFINKLAKRKAAKIGDKPGVTKSQTWIKVENNLFLLDTPGILWPKFEEETVALNLAVTGSIKDEILPLEDVTNYALSFMQKNYLDFLKNRYQIDIDSETELLEVYDLIAQKRGCVAKGGDIDYDRVINLIIYDIRHNKIGGMTFDRQ